MISHINSKNGLQVLKKKAMDAEVIDLISDRESDEDEVELIGSKLSLKLPPLKLVCFLDGLDTSFKIKRLACDSCIYSEIISCSLLKVHQMCDNQMILKPSESNSKKESIPDDSNLNKLVNTENEENKVEPIIFEQIIETEINDSVKEKDLTIVSESKSNIEIEDINEHASEPECLQNNDENLKTYRCGFFKKLSKKQASNNRKCSQKFRRWGRKHDK